MHQDPRRQGIRDCSSQQKILHRLLPTLAAPVQQISKEEVPKFLGPKLHQNQASRPLLHNVAANCRDFDESADPRIVRGVKLRLQGAKEYS